MRSILAAAAALAISGAASADFALGQPITANGWGDGPFATQVGTWAGQGFHNIGGVNQWVDPFFTALFMTISSTLAPGHLSIVLDWTTFGPGDFPTIGMDFLGLKQDGTIVEVSASIGSVVTNGNDVFWTAAGASLAGAPVKIDIFQIPAPGALALVGLAGLTARRRRA